MTIHIWRSRKSLLRNRGLKIMLLSEHQFRVNRMASFSQVWKINDHAYQKHPKVLLHIENWTKQNSFSDLTEQRNCHGSGSSQESCQGSPQRSPQTSHQCKYIWIFIFVVWIKQQRTLYCPSSCSTYNGLHSFLFQTHLWCPWSNRTL